MKPPHRAGFHDLCKPKCIVFLTFLPAVNHRASMVDQFVTHCIQSRHFIFTLSHLPLKVALNLAATGHPVLT